MTDPGEDAANEWYTSAGKGMGDVLTMASEMEAYTMTDRATYLAMKDDLDLVIVVEGAEDLFNQYGVIAVDASVSDGINTEGGQAFVDWIRTGNQELIKGYGVEEYGEPLFVPNAQIVPFGMHTEVKERTLCPFFPNVEDRMQHLLNGFREAFVLLSNLDKEIFDIIFLSFRVSLTATVLGALFCIPTGIALGITPFRGKRIFGRILFTLMSTPSVIVGLLVLLFISRNGPLGFLGILYTPTAMILAQTLLVAPLLLGLSFSLARQQGRVIDRVGKTLGASFGRRVILVMRELKAESLAHAMTGFSRAISEVGAVMIVGGNIKYHTRVMTTAITRLNSMGEYPTAIALGIVLFIISLLINSLLYRFQEGPSYEDRM